MASDRRPGSGGAFFAFLMACLVTPDARSWQRLPFPDLVDLVAIDATDDRTATATAADGRRFTTTDRGQSWKRYTGVTMEWHGGRGRSRP